MINIQFHIKLWYVLAEPLLLKGGTYKTSSKYRWGKLIHDVYGQYATRIVGSILFHSVPYSSNKANTLLFNEYDKLGTKASAGCVRLTVKDAKWIYDNCPKGTMVEFYSSSEPGPLGKPTAQKISSVEECRNWDPTDPSTENPWHTYNPEEEKTNQDISNSIENTVTNNVSNSIVNNINNNLVINNNVVQNSTISNNTTVNNSIITNNTITNTNSTTNNVSNSVISNNTITDTNNVVNNITNNTITNSTNTVTGNNIQNNNTSSVENSTTSSNIVTENNNVTSKNNTVNNTNNLMVNNMV